MEEATAMETLGQVMTFLWGQLSTVVTTIVANPLLLVTVGTSVIFAVIAVAKKFIK